MKGYDQVSGIDFQYNFAPITSEVTDYFCEVADVQTAFLHGNLEEELFIKIPPGYHKFFDEQKESIIKNFWTWQSLPMDWFKQLGPGVRSLQVFSRLSWTLSNMQVIAVC